MRGLEERFQVFIVLVINDFLKSSIIKEKKAVSTIQSFRNNLFNHTETTCFNDYHNGVIKGLQKCATQSSESLIT